MAFVLTRALGRLHLSSSVPRLLSTSIPQRYVQPRPEFSFSHSLGGRSLQVQEVSKLTIAPFSSAVRCTKSAEKRHRQSEKRRARNRARKAEVKTCMKKVLRALDGFKKELPKEEKELDPISPLMLEAFMAIDKAVTKGAFHRNTGVRRKSRLERARLRLLTEAGLYKPPAKPKTPSLVEAYEERQKLRREAARKRMAERLKAIEATEATATA